MGARAEELLKRRFRIIKFSNPLFPPTPLLRPHYICITLTSVQRLAAAL
jgi:hypothetical protein